MGVQHKGKIITIENTHLASQAHTPNERGENKSSFAIKCIRKADVQLKTFSVVL